MAVSDSAREKFQREVEVMKDLLHRNIVALLEHGSAGSAFYFIMELCEGGSVGDWLARHGGRLSLAKAAPIFQQSLEGLAHAHAKGFVHRDFKPHNRGSFLNLNPNRNLTPVLASQREIRIKITNKIKREPRVDFLHPHLSRPG